MEEKLNELYQAYLEETLDKIFLSKVKETKTFLEHKFYVDSEDIVFYKFYEGVAKVRIRGKNLSLNAWKSWRYNFIDRKGKLLSKGGWFKDAKDFHYGLAEVKIQPKDSSILNYIDRNGNPVLKDWQYWTERLPEEELIELSSKNFPRDLGKYRVIKMFNKYICKKGKDSFKTKHKPMKIYGKSIVLCLDENYFYLFDRNNNTYKCLGTIREVSYDDYFIYTREKVLFVFKNKIYDITDYYRHNREIIDSIIITKISKDINILTKNEFFVTYEKEIKEARDKQQALEAIKKREEDIKRLEELQNESKERQRKQEILRKEAISQVTEGFQKIQKYSEESGEKIRVEIDEKEFLIEVGDHKEINPLYLNTSFYKYIDLSLISLKNVKISGIDFRDCNIHLNPQKVYNKDLTNCNFEGINIPPFMDFTDVDIRGAKFSKDNDWKTQDGYNQTLINAIYDETTTYNGIPFTDIYGPCKQTKRNTK